MVAWYAIYTDTIWQYMGPLGRNELTHDGQVFHLWHHMASLGHKLNGSSWNIEHKSFCTENTFENYVHKIKANWLTASMRLWHDQDVKPHKN